MRYDLDIARLAGLAPHSIPILNDEWRWECMVRLEDKELLICMTGNDLEAKKTPASRFNQDGRGAKERLNDFCGFSATWAKRDGGRLFLG
ncbi:hypothetical protein J3458_005252 [Metarhizium acridum]|uniref:uncharacterized protein n=1 Tax=Metarhizium acridum TaxID=92637 RepID=UPI001C6C2FE1|nr:hypothetical protein J3458_005252 [Metarhizium acridum]